MMNIILNFFFVVGILPKNDIGVEIFTRNGEKLLLSSNNTDYNNILTTILVEKNRNFPLLFSFNSNKEVKSVLKCELLKVMSIDKEKKTYNLSKRQCIVPNEEIEKKLNDSFKNNLKVWCCIDENHNVKDVLPYKMLTETECINIALFKIFEIKPEAHYMLINEKIETHKIGWVFYYSTKKFLETGDKKYLIPGSLPFVVDNLDGSVHTINILVNKETFFKIYTKHWEERFNNFYD